MPIRPTYDDWYSLSAPNFDKDFTKYFLPFGSVWRPFDAAIGYILSIDYRMFPTLNHILVLAGHAASTMLVWNLCRRLNFTATANGIATTFFFASPCMLGTVLSCDSMNQVYSNFWGLMSVWCFLKYNNNIRFFLYATCVIMATLSKDNGITWAVVPPLFASAFGFIDKRKTFNYFMLGLLLAAAYMAVRLSLPKTEIINPEYSNFLLTKKVRDLCVALGYTWVAADYICIFHAPSRNLLVAIITVLFSFPFFYVLFMRNFRQWKTRPFLTIAVCIIIVLSPNLLITMSVMNVYAGLGMSALLVGYIVNEYGTDTAFVKKAFALYLLVAIPVDLHHWYKAWQTSLAGRDMAVDTLKNTDGIKDKVYAITIEDNERKFSSFCVLPSDAFSGGMAALYENGYTWPETLRDTTIERNINSAEKARALAEEAIRKRGYQCVWIVDKNKVTVVK